MAQNHRTIKSVDIIFYAKQDCNLCEDMKKSLTAFISRLDKKFTVNVIMRDIDDQVQWFDRFREYVPVLMVNEEEICHYFIDNEELTAAIERQAHYVGKLRNRSVT